MNGLGCEISTCLKRNLEAAFNSTRSIKSNPFEFALSSLGDLKLEDGCDSFRLPSLMDQ